MTKGTGQIRAYARLGFCERYTEIINFIAKAGAQVAEDNIRELIVRRRVKGETIDGSNNPRLRKAIEQANEAAASARRKGRVNCLHEFCVACDWWYFLLAKRARPILQR